MQSPAQKLADFHAFHGACGSVVDIKPGRHPSKAGHHALFAWCPACGATSREVVELAQLDIWLGSDTTTADGGSEFTQAMLKARQKIMSAQGRGTVPQRVSFQQTTAFGTGPSAVF